MMTITNLITLISSIVAAIGVIFVAYQAHVAKESLKQIKVSNEKTSESINIAKDSLSAEHERARREKACELVFTWSSNIELESTFARRLVEKLDHDTVEKIYDQEAVVIDSKHISLVAGCLRNSDESALKVEGQHIRLTEKQSVHIDWLITKYLNNLESVFVHWQNGIADEQVLKEQYRFLVNPSKNIFILQKYRNAKDGVEHFPAIRDFSNLLAQEHEVENGRRDKIA